MGVLLKTMCGTRDAGAEWEGDYCSEVFEGSGANAGLFSPCLFLQEQTKVKAWAHGGTCRSYCTTLALTRRVQSHCRAPVRMVWRSLAKANYPRRNGQSSGPSRCVQRSWRLPYLMQPVKRGSEKDAGAHGAGHGSNQRYSR